MEKRLNIHEFNKRYIETYNFLYDTDDEYDIEWYEEAIKAFDKFIKVHGDFVGEFARYHGDYITSDREAAAFMYALSTMA